MPDLIWEIDDRDGVFFTFDDGPRPVSPNGSSPRSTSTMPKRRFRLGQERRDVPRSLPPHPSTPDTAVGNHTYPPQKGWGMSLERYTEDVDFANDLIHSDSVPGALCADHTGAGPVPWGSATSW